MRWAHLILVSLLAIGGCASGPSYSFEAFSRNKLAVLERNLESTRDAQSAATDQIVSSVDLIKKETGEGADPGRAYDLARRALATCESRARAAHNRIKVVEANGNDFFHQWSKENYEYADPDLKESSRVNRVKIKASFDVVIERMKAVDEATEPVLVALRDQMLFLKHHRDTAAVPPRPPHAQDPAGPLEALVNKTTQAAAKTEDFTNAVHASSN